MDSDPGGSKAEGRVGNPRPPPIRTEGTIRPDRMRDGLRHFQCGLPRAPRANGRGAPDRRGHRLVPGAALLVVASANLPWRIRGGIDHAGGTTFRYIP